MSLGGEYTGYALDEDVDLTKPRHVRIILRRTFWVLMARMQYMVGGRRGHWIIVHDAGRYISMVIPKADTPGWRAAKR